MEARSERPHSGKGMPGFEAWIASLPEVVGNEVQEREADPLGYEWGKHARDTQMWPNRDWRIWLILAGRGFGKTRTGSEIVNVVANSNCVARIALVGETADDVRDVMVEGPDGILARSHPSVRPAYEPSKRRLTWPNQCVATTYAGADPEQLRGPQHGFAWVDELAKYQKAEELWMNLMLGLRMGRDPRVLVTTTPRPIPLIRALRAAQEDGVLVTHGTTFDNRANLPSTFVKDILARYEGTAIGRQELHAEVLDEAEGALWRRAEIDAHRVRMAPDDLARVVVAVDPSVARGGGGDACGIVVAGMSRVEAPQLYILADFTLHAGPSDWAKEVARAARHFEAHEVVAESNQGGEMVRDVLHAADEHLNVKLVRARTSKEARASSVSVYYDRGMVHHVGSLPKLEDELVGWAPGRASPNRMDALVWALIRLLPPRGNGAVAGEVV